MTPLILTIAGGLAIGSVMAWMLRDVPSALLLAVPAGGGVGGLVHLWIDRDRRKR